MNDELIDSEIVFNKCFSNILAKSNNERILKIFAQMPAEDAFRIADILFVEYINCPLGEP